MNSKYVIFLVIALAGCSDKENTNSESLQKLDRETDEIRVEKPSKLDVCMTALYPSAASFETLGTSDKDNIRRCIQSALKDEGRLTLTRDISAVTSESPEMSEDEKWISQHGLEVCKAGVSFKNRWGDLGQAREGKYLHFRNGEYIFREHAGSAKIRCYIAGKRLLMGWHTRPFDIYKFGDVHYTFESTESGVRISEHAYGELKHRDYDF